MDLPPALQTERLILRQWLDFDIEPFAAMNNDKEVMRYFPKLNTRQETEAMVSRLQAAFAANGFGLWAAELRDSAEFIGFIGLSRPQFEAQFTPCVEIGWRLAAKFWGQGLAVEGAREVLRDGFERVGLQEIVSFTSSHNIPSIRVMQKLGMKCDPNDTFIHPALNEDHWLSEHVLYRLSVRDWRANLPTHKSL